jgi:hypothetical protein
MEEKQMSKFNKYTIGEFIDFACDEGIRTGADIVVSVGEVSLNIPLTPEAFEGMEHWLHDTLKIWEEDYL